MIKTKLYPERLAGYEKVIADNKNDNTRTEFEKTITERLFKWWSEWVPDYEGWLKIADGLYAPEGEIIAIGPKSQKYCDYRLSMKGQRDAFDMDMGPIDDCVVEKDTVAIDYKMYMTAKADMPQLRMKKGDTKVLKVTEFNTFANVDGFDVPMVVRLKLIATGL